LPIQTDLSVAPYFDDYDDLKNYHQVLFKPGVALQTRELNVLQTMLQRQIELFGDNIFVKGTIISGCNFKYDSAYPYVKINDLQSDGLSAVPINYVGLYGNGSIQGLGSFVLNSNTGYQSQAPDLNTLYLRYLNSGANGTQTAYANDEVITLSDANNSIFQVNVPVGGTGAGFANSDTVVFQSAISVNNTASFGAGQALVGNTVYVGASFAAATIRATVVGVNTTAIANTIVLNIAPYGADLTNNSVTSSKWTFSNNSSVKIGNASVLIDGSATITSIIGSGANAIPTTDSTGKILSMTMVTGGGQYTIPPYVTVKTTNTAASIAPISGTTSALVAQNYYAKVTVANASSSGSSNASGFAYAFSVSEGVIYQKGYFLHVDPQTIVVSKYSNLPDQIMVGFNTTESIINSNIDTSLLDNATGTFNTLAPGADRLQLSPSLTVVSANDAAGNTSFFPITAFSLGAPYLQNQQTQYNVIGDSIAEGIYNTSGNFVIKPFTLSTVSANLDSSTDASTQAAQFNAVVSPGEAYISGHKVELKSNYVIPVYKGINTYSTNAAISTNYGNYLNINQIGGVFNYTLGDYVTLYDTATSHLSNATAYAAGSPTPTGNAIGTARIRSMVPTAGTGTPGTPSHQHRMYVYDVNMYPGKSILNAKGVGYSNTFTGVADIVGTVVASLANASLTVAKNVASSAMVFDLNVAATKDISNVYFTYKGLFTGGSTISHGNVSIDTANGTVKVQLGTHAFPYGNNLTLTDNQLGDISLIFHAGPAQANANATVTFTTTASSNLVTTTDTSTLSPGDYWKIYSNGTASTSGEIRRLNAVINSTALQFDSNFTQSNSTVQGVMYFPQNVAVPLSGRPLKDRYATISTSGGNPILAINIGKSLNSTSFTSNATVMVPVVAIAATQQTKTPKRDTTVAINISNSNFGTTGPWAMGHTDIIRLKKVYLDVNTNILSVIGGAGINIASAAAIPSTWQDVTNQFYIDHGQNTDYYNHGYLTLKPGSKLSITNSNALLVQFDHLTATSGFYTKSSYPVADTQPYANLAATASTNIHHHEIPEFYSDQGQYYDLVNAIDFRPRIANTANVTAANTSTSTVNPVDLGSVPTVTITGNTLSGNYWITSISSNTNIVVGELITSNIASAIPAGTLVASVNATHVVMTNPAGVTANPAKLTFAGDATKFTYGGSSLSPQAIPIDGGQLSINTTQYLGRVDRVILTPKGEVQVLAGTPGNGVLSPPAEPANTLTINLLFVPPYPSVPGQVDLNTTQILDKGVGSKIFTVQRASDHNISIPVANNSQLSVYQPRGYTMAQIAQLERRIASIEYYNTLSQLEQGVNRLAVPSSLNGSINRFKYGFFADNFNTTSYSDVNNPEYNATILNGEVVPKHVRTNVEFVFNLAHAATSNGVNGAFLTLPYNPANTFTLISQMSITNGPVKVTSVANTASNTASNTYHYVDTNVNEETIEVNNNTSEPNEYTTVPSTYKGTMTVTPQSFTIITATPANTVPAKYVGVGLGLGVGGGGGIGIGGGSAGGFGVIKCAGGVTGTINSYAYLQLVTLAVSRT